MADTALTKDRAINDLIIAQVHRSRYHRVAILHESEEQVAEQDGVKVESVRASIAIVNSHRSQLTMDELEMSQIDVLNSCQEKEREALLRGLTAMKTVKDSRGRNRRVPDIEVQLDAVRVLNEKIEAINNRDKGVRIFNQQIANQQATAVTAPSGAVLFEDRVRQKIRNFETKHLPPGVAKPVAGPEEEPLPESDITIEANKAQRP